MSQSQIFTRHFLRAGALLLVGGAAYLTAYLLRFPGPQFQSHAFAIFAGSLPCVLAAKLAAIVWFRIHQGWSRYASFHDLAIIAQSTTAATVAITVCDALLLTQHTIPRSVLLLDWGATLVALTGIRAVLRIFRDGVRHPFARRQGTPVLIVGANDAGEGLLRAIKQNPNIDYRPVGFVDDRPRRQGRRIAGVPVLGGLKAIPEFAAQYGVGEVLIHSGDLPGRRVRELVDQAANGGFRVKVLPSYEQLLGERIAVQPRPVNIADLLRRPSVRIEDANTRRWLAGRKVLVTGSAGSIGSELCRQLLELGPESLVVLDRSETGQFYLQRELQGVRADTNIEVVLGDLTDQQRLRAVFQQHQPDIVFHAAAYKHVPLMETHVGEAVKNIVVATRNLADLADEFQVEGFVMISTDKAVNPSSVMGSCKRLAEQYVQAKADASECRFVTVRFGNVLDSAGSVVPIFREQIARGGPVTVTHENMVRYFMLIPEAAQLVIQAGTMGSGGEIFVLDMGEPVRVMDLARDMIQLSGLRVGDDVEIKVTGLRPGEKLFEELYGDEENHQKTEHPKIMVAAGQPRPLLELIYDVGRLTEVANGPNQQCAALLREIIPPYEPPAADTARAA